MRPPWLILWLVLLAPFCAAREADRADAVDVGWILSRIARPAPSQTPFLELRGSRLLKAPLRIEGEYRRPDEATLVREVRTPYAETTTISSATGKVLIARPGKSPRGFSLSRVPELASLQASFGALLSGDRVLLERQYRLAVTGSRQHWTLGLTPKDPQVAARVRGITLYGRGAELRCIETQPAKGSDVQRTLLAGAAREAVPADGNDALGALCRGEARE